MRVDEWLRTATTTLSSAGISTARLDALVLLEDATDKDRTHLLAHQEQKLSEKHINVLNGWIARRATHEPLAYIRGKTEFYGREFVVSPAVLEPRPESETMIDLLLGTSDLPTHPHIADVGTGSGALGITAKLELPEASVELIDIDPEALNIAKVNVINFATSISTVQSDLLAATRGNYDILLCNLPYVPDNFQINEAAMNEPRIAIFGGPDGLDLYRKLFTQLDIVRTKPLLILTESLPPQHELLNDIASQHGYTQVTQSDFIQLFRLIN